MIKVVAKLKIQNEKIEEFKNIASEMIDSTRVEKGCISYELYQDNGFRIPGPDGEEEKTSSTIFYFIEMWENQEAIDAHLQAEHMANLLPLVFQMLDGELDVTCMELVK